MRRLYPQSLRGRMILSFVLAGAVPLIACLALLDWRVSTGAGKVTDWTNQTLVQAVYRRLSAVRDIHSEALARDLEQRAEDIRNFAGDPAVMTAAKEFAAIESRPEEAQSLSTATSEVQRSEISKFYREQFGPAFVERKGMPCELHKAYAAGLDEMALGLQYSYIASNPNPLGSKHLLSSVPGEAAYHQLHGIFHPRASSILSLGGYYDVFVVTPQSRRVIYSVYKEIDFGVRLEGVLIGESGLARAVDAFLANPRPGRVHIEDFAAYRPSYDAPASFLSTGVFEGSQLVGVAVFQLPVDRFTALVASRAGLGESGETLVVGADYLPRTDSTIDPLQRSVAAAWANPDRARVDTPLIRAALEGKSGLDRGRSYHGGEVLAAYTPLRILGLNWALMVEQNFEEAMAEREEYSALAGEQEDERKLLKVVMALLGLGLVLIIGISIGTSISRPIQATKRTLSAFAKGDLGYSEPIETSGELLEMIQALDLARDNLRQTFGVVGSAMQELRRVTDGLGTLSYELLHRSQDGTQKVSRASASVGDVSAAMHALGSACHQMMASVREISVSSSQVARQAQEAAREAEETGSAMARLTQSSNEIGEVTAVIRKIAEQTNLLALNATIEAARAAEAGKGFAVVATEVKELSNGTSKATKEIIHRIDSMQADTKLSYSAIESIAQTVARASEAQQSVATAVEEQSAVTSEIARNATHCLQDIETVVTELKNLHQSAELTVLSSEKAQATAVRVLGLAQRVEELLAAYRLD